MVSVVAIKLDQLRDIPADQIPRPSVFHNMESAATVEAALPGIGVVRRDKDEDEPVDFFSTKCVRHDFRLRCGKPRKFIGHLARHYAGARPEISVSRTKLHRKIPYR